MPDATHPDQSNDDRGGAASFLPDSLFATTHWSVVLAAADTRPEVNVALETLCRTYWYPLYSFVRRCGEKPEDAQDLTQEFFARFLARGSLSSADPTRGRFRWYLLASFKHFLANERDRANAGKRGGGLLPVSLDSLDAEDRYRLEPREQISPDKSFDRAWGLTLMGRARLRLRDELAEAGRVDRFEALEPFLGGDPARETYGQIATRLGVAEGTIKSDVSRLRRRYGELVREEVAATVGTHVDFVDELHHLIEAVSE